MRYLFLAVLCVALAGCGGSSSNEPAAAAPVLLKIQRQGGEIATQDVLTVRTDGSAVLDKRHGGAGRKIERFRISDTRMATIRRDLRRLPARLHRPAAPAPAITYMLRVRGQLYISQVGTMRAPEKPLFLTLDDVLVAGGGRA